MSSSFWTNIVTWPAWTNMQVSFSLHLSLSRPLGKPTICIGENKGADQLRSNCEADQRLCFRYMDSTIPLLSKSKISCLQPSSVLVQLSLCQTCSETTLLVFPRDGSFVIILPNTGEQQELSSSPTNPLSIK